MSRVTMSIAILLLAATPVSAQLESTLLVHTEDGTALRVDHSAEPSEVVAPLPSGDDLLVWQRHIEVYIYTSCGIAADGFYGGTRNVTPAVVENLDQGGTPNWIYDGLFDNTKVHRGAMVEVNYDIDGATVRGNYNEVTGWGWRVDIPNVYLPAAPIKQTHDGDRVVVTVGVWGDHSVVYCFDGIDGTEISAWHADSGEYPPRTLSITEDGGLAAMRGGARLYVIDTTTGTRLWSTDLGSSADGLGISPDGHWLTAGWQELQVWERVGDSYAFRWAEHLGNLNSHFLGACAVNSNGDIVAAWYRNNFRQTKVQMVDAEVGGEGLVYEGPVTNGVYQEVPSAINFEDTSNLAVVGNWGDDSGLSPEVLVFQYGDPHPVASLDTPGSIFALDTRADQSGGLEIVACGKAVHANQFGNGGDYFYMVMQGVVSNEDDEEQPAELPQFATALSGAHPNPFNPMTTISFSLSREQRVKLSVFDMAGKLVAELIDGVFAAGEHPVIWNGQDLHGREVASGTYVIYMETEDQVRSSKMMLVR